MPKGKQGRTAEVLLTEAGLNPQQELFCKLYASDKEFFCNGVQSYAEAYDIDLTSKSGYSTAKANATRLLTNASILKRIDQLLELQDLNYQVADKRLAFWMTQSAYPPQSMDAIKEFNRLKKRIDDKAQVNVNISLAELFDKAQKEEL